MKNNAIALRLAVVLSVAVFLFWRCRYGFANIDECFNLSLAYRLWQGDSLLVDMWDLQQFFGVVMLPIVWVYMKVLGTTEGLLLNFRYLFEIFMLVVATFHYVRWRSYDERGAFWGSVAFAATCPFSLNNFTYNSVGVMVFSVAITLYATNMAHRKLDCAFCGFFYALSVLCCPFLILIFPIFVFACWYRRSLGDEAVPFVLGSCIVGFSVLALILSRASLGDIIAAIPNYFGDSEHANRSFGIIIRDWGGHFLLVQGAWSFVVLVCAGLAFAYQRWFDAKSSAHAEVYRTLYMLIGFILLIEAIVLRPWPDFPILSICVIALLSLNFAQNSQRHIIIWTGIVPAFLYGFCICAGSNQGSFVISSVLAVSIVPACVVFSLEYGKISRSLVLIFFLVQTLGLIYSRCHIVFWDAPMCNLTRVIEKGPHKGIVTTSNNAEWNESVFDLTRSALAGKKAEYVYFQLKSLWQCYMTDKRIGAYSLWVTDIKENAPDDEFMVRMDRYYEMHPDKVPTVISLNSDSIRAIEHFKSKYGFHEVAKNKYAIILRRE